MTTEMFGAPYGIQQAEQDINANTLSGLKAQELLGAIAMQPAQKAQALAHARLFQAQAMKAEADAADASGWTAFQRDAMGKLGGMAERVGPPNPDGTPAQAPMQGPQSAATPLIQLGTLAANAGFTKQATTLLDKGTLIMSHEQAARSSATTAALTQLRIQQQQAENAGAMAASVQDQGSYDRLRMQLAGQGTDVSWMPPDYASAKPLLDQTAKEGMKASEQLKAKQEKIKTDSLLARRGNQNALGNARVAEVKAHTELLKVRKDAVVKNGGDGSPLAKEAKQALIDSRRAAQAKTEAFLYPPLPNSARDDPKLRVVGQTYSLPKGRFTWTGAGWTPFKGKAAAVSVGADEADTTDDSSEEE